MADADTFKIPNPEDPGETLAAVVALRVLSDKLERQAVKKAIARGWTWAQIAEALGVTRQAVHKKHAANIKQEVE